MVTDTRLSHKSVNVSARVGKGLTRHHNWIAIGRFHMIHWMTWKYGQYWLYIVGNEEKEDQGEGWEEEKEHHEVLRESITECQEKVGGRIGRWLWSHFIVYTIACIVNI